MDMSIAGLQSLVSLQQPQAIFVVLLSVLVPLSIFVGRRNVRIRRLRMLRNLRRVLPLTGEQIFLLPGFTMVEARYLDEAEGRRLWSRVLAWLQEIGIYLLPTLVFVLVSGCGFALLFKLGGDWLSATNILLQGLQAADGNAASFASTTALVMAAGFVGAYIWSVNYLILRIANFDLSPLSFLSTAAHILMTVFVAWVLRQVVATPAPGLYPSLGLNVLIDRLPSWLRFKRDIPEASQIGRSFPLDLIDGVDTTIKFRLNGLDVADVQNLATANPVELFVETPYGFGQILDWMAQAQLLVELGPQRFIAARLHGIRDLMAFLDLSRSDGGRELLGRALSVSGNADQALQAWVESIARKLHVRQMGHWMALFARTLEAPTAKEPVADGKIMPLRATS